jgi:hypothetical protein
LPSARPSIPCPDIRTRDASSYEAITLEHSIVAGEQISELTRYCLATCVDLCEVISKDRAQLAQFIR